MDLVKNAVICERVHVCMCMYVVNRRQRRKNRIVKKLMIGDNRRKSIVEIWRWNQTRNDIIDKGTRLRAILALTFLL